MLRRTHPEPIDALPMLKEKGLKKFTDVYTRDGEHLGAALRLFYRPEDEVNPLLKLWGAYVEVVSIELGGPAFIPTEFVADYDPAANRLTLSADLRMVEDELWNRMPEFVAGGRGAHEELPAD